MYFNELKEYLLQFREHLEYAFSPETSIDGQVSDTKSHGHCAVVSYLLHKKLNADMVSTTINGQSHWFNRLKVSEGTVEFDLTADQFGHGKVRIIFGKLYDTEKDRDESELNEETLQRVEILERRLY